MTAIARVAIIGVGLIGGSLGLALRARRPEIAVHGITRDPEQARRAIAAGAVTSAGTRLEDAAHSDLAVIAAPLDATFRLLEQLARVMPAGLITDVGSVKADVVGAAQRLPAPHRFLGGHPMAGRSESGLAAADPDLFAGAAWVFTPAPGQDVAAFEPWIACVRSLGARPVFMDPEEHDVRVALVSHLAFLLSSVYAATIQASDEPARTALVAGPGFRDMIRLATGDPRMYAAIIEHNRAPIRATLDALQASLARYRELLERDGPALLSLLEETASQARGWLRA
ncbi:MAG TPA: prephenate dehydrogenase/arogenate dehydrogenase family protein [Candidatus Limnocylindrales bacterium]|nr:prephenate dehydrogenase/arogenate dehydrogenase family protein [Candidatus Limnocylindrales bacterium]